MQAKMNVWVQYVVMVALVGLLIFQFVPQEPVEVQSEVDYEKIASVVVSNLPEPQEVPTASEITSEIEKSTASSESDKIKHLYNKLFSEEKENLEENASDEYGENLHNFSEFEDEVSKLISDFDELMNKSPVEDSEEVEVLNLGLDDKEDRLVEVTEEYKIRYQNTESFDELKETILVKGTVSYDEDEGYEVEYSYSIK